MSKEAVVLLNMGGPNNLDEVEMFLKNMFNDKNILTMKSNVLRKMIGGMIVFNRTESSQEIYRELGGKSPIVGHTKNLVEKLQTRLGENVIVDFAMRYTPPFADEVIKKLNAEDIEKIYLIPLYPQYSTTTTKSSLEDFEEHYHEAQGDAVLVEIKHFFENETYNKFHKNKANSINLGSILSDSDNTYSNTKYDASLYYSLNNRINDLLKHPNHESLNDRYNNFLEREFPEEIYFIKVTIIYSAKFTFVDLHLNKDMTLVEAVKKTSAIPGGH